MLKAAGQTFLINDFSMGLDWTSGQAAVGEKWLIDAKNVHLTNRKTLLKRRGMYPFPTTSARIAAADIQSIYEYDAPDGTNYLLAACSTKIVRRSVNSWVDVKTGLTDGLRYSFASYAGYCYGANGTDANFKIYNTTASSLGVTAPTTDPIAVGGAIQTTSQTDSYTFSVANYLNLRYDNTLINIGETFTMPVKATITSITTWLKKINSPTGNVWIEVWTVNGTSSLGEQVGSDSATVDVSTLNASGATQAFAFSDMPELDIGQKYAFVLHGDFTTSTTNYVQVGKSTSNTYTQGTSFRINAAGSWVWIGPDLYMTLTYASHTAGAGLSGKYKWVYTYVNTAGSESNPSDASNVLDLTSQAATITVAYTTTSDIDYIRLYRTLNMYDGDPDNINEYYKVGDDVANDTDGGTIGIEDTTSDNELTNLLAYDNTVPPKAKFLTVFQDCMIYANCPDEEDGASLFMTSKPGQPEACPSLNYHYFDRDDGNAITGVAVLPDYLIVFKKNKIATMASDFSEWTTISSGIGCIAPWAIITMTDKVLFISEEGPKATDGRTIYDIGKKLDKLLHQGIWNITSGAEFSGVYYPYRKQFYFALPDASIVLVGHWLASLYMDITPEFAQGDNYVGWTYHDYPQIGGYSGTIDVAPTALGSYTDSSGITRILGGIGSGYVYELDYSTYNYDTDYSGTTHDIEISIITGWNSYEVPIGIDKTTRSVNVIAGRDEDEDSAVKMYVDVDYNDASDYVSMNQSIGTATDPSLSLGGVSGYFTKNFDMVSSATGKMFRFRLEGDDSDGFELISLQPFYRIEGIR